MVHWRNGRPDGFRTVDRRKVLVGLLAGASVVGVLFFVLPAPPVVWFVLAALYGIVMSPTYSVAAAHTYDHAAPGTFVETAAGLFVANASAGIAGPLLASATMGVVGSAGLFLFTAIAQGGLAVYVVLRMRRRPAPATPDKTAFDLAATSPVVGGLPPETVEAEPVVDDEPDARSRAAE